MHILARDVDGDGQDEIAIFTWSSEIEVWSIGGGSPGRGTHHKFGRPRSAMGFVLQQV